MFGSRNPRPSPSQQPSPAGNYSRITPDSSDRYGAPPSAYGRPGPHQGGSRDSEKHDYNGQPMDFQRQSGGRGRGGQTWELKPDKSPSNDYTYGNLVAVSPFDFPPKPDGSDFYIIINERFVLTARPFDGFQQGRLSLSDPQRTWMSVTLQDLINVRIFDPFQDGGGRYISSMDAQISFAGRKSTKDPLDQEKLMAVFTKNFYNQIFAPQQRIIMDFQSFPLLIIVQTVQLADPSMKSTGADQQSHTDPRARGILTPQTLMNFSKDNRSGELNLTASRRRPAASAIIQPDFKFEDMGIGGLDKEFSTIFRRAFASRIFPPGLIQDMGIQHVKGILLFGPPGTGKTLIARRIGQMLNAREPKVINGPEVLNKFVGQSEENIRKLFADAEKEYKEKGDESGLHIIIFDELDAVCKQRGSGAGGGTGVGDSVVNQLLSKLDGVDQLNNILLIGMTNRMDMIDDALLRPGRLEVHMEISLPDEYGRVQILKIHTNSMRKSNRLDHDVDLAELAHETKNFSGAEISGLVRSATSFAMNRHVKGGTSTQLTEDVMKIKVNRDDFQHALDDVKPAFGVAEDEMQGCLVKGILHFSLSIKNILDEANLFVQQVRDPDSPPLFSAILHGPPGSGKTALAAEIALKSDYPFIKLISPDTMGTGEFLKVEYLRKTFDDAYKSPLSIVVIDNIERIIEWSPIGPRFSNPVLQMIMVLIKKRPPKDRRLLVLATSSKRTVLEQLDLFEQFSSDIAVPNVGTQGELHHILQTVGAFADPARAVRELQEITKQDRVGVGIKQILEGIDTSKRHQDREGHFASLMAKAMIRSGGQ